jgi:serine phosphatase RsbU (regulator of sigma subunit)
MLLLLPLNSLTAQNKDSLKKVFSTSKISENKIQLGVEIIKSWQGTHDSVVFYTNYFLKFWEKENNQLAQAYTYCILTRVFCEEGKFDKAIEYGQKSVDIGTKIKNDSTVAKAYINIGYTHYSAGDFEKATEAYYNSLKYSEPNKHERLTASAYNYLGLTFSTKRKPDYKKALDYLFKALEIDRRTKFSKDMGFALLRIGAVYAWQGDLDKGSNYINAASRVADSCKIIDLQKWSIEFSADIYNQKKEYKKALSMYLKSLRISLSINEIPGIVNSYINISDAHKHMGDYKNAHLYIDSAYFVCREFKTHSVFAHVYSCKSDIYEKQGDIKNAFLYYKKSAMAKDSVFSQKNSDNLNELETKYESEKKEKQLSEKNSELKIQKAESEKRQTQRNAFIVGFAIVIILLAFIFRGYRQKQKANEIIQLQKQLVEEKNKDITDSINYAKKIQEAILPAKELKYKLFPEAFVLFQPRDIVSGDFYWFAEKNGKKLIAAVDCTGHGVPGAFMSMIGNAFLNEIINENGITNPASILNRLNELVVSSLKQYESENKDGMDISILSFNEQSSVVEFAGANNPLWHIRNKIVNETKGDKQPIGAYGESGILFTNHKIELQRGDALYIFTDGYADQFGGPKGKKFKYKQLEEVIVSMQNEPMQVQEDILIERMNAWRGTLEQVDDILVIGVKV